MEKPPEHRLNACLVNALYWCHMMPNHVRRVRTDSALKKWPHFVPDGEQFEIVDWIEAPEASELAKSQSAFENPALENLIFYRLNLAP